MKMSKTLKAIRRDIAEHEYANAAISMLTDEQREDASTQRAIAFHAKALLRLREKFDKAAALC